MTTTNFKSRQRTWKDISPNKYTNGKDAYGNMLSITQGNENQNCINSHLIPNIMANLFVKQTNKQTESNKCCWGYG